MTLNGPTGLAPRCRKANTGDKQVVYRTYKERRAPRSWRRQRSCAHDVERWARRPVSRVLCRPGPRARTRRPFLWTGPCGPVLATNPDLLGAATPLPFPPRRRGRAVPIRSCSRRGLPCGPRCRSPGALLPHPFTLTFPEGKAVCSLWRCPWDRSRRVLPAASSSWSPDFPRRACTRRDRPAIWPAACVAEGTGAVNRGSPRHRPARRHQLRAARSRAVRRARVSPSATPSTCVGRQCRWKAATTATVAGSKPPVGGAS